MKKYLIVFQQEGSGLSFKFMSSASEEEANKVDGMKVGKFAYMYKAEIISETDEWEIENMIITIPYIYKCPNLIYNKTKDRFVEA